MTIDERVESYLAKSSAYQMAAVGTKQLALQGLKTLLQEVARDQRHACAEAVYALEVSADIPTAEMRHRAHLAVMNATIK